MDQLDAEDSVFEKRAWPFPGRPVRAMQNSAAFGWLEQPLNTVLRPLNIFSAGALGNRRYGLLSASLLSSGERETGPAHNFGSRLAIRVLRVHSGRINVQRFICIHIFVHLFDPTDFREWLAETPRELHCQLRVICDFVFPLLECII